MLVMMSRAVRTIGRWLTVASCAYGACAVMLAQVPSSKPLLWWRDAKMAADLALTPTQMDRLNGTFEEHLPERIALRGTIVEKDDELRRILEAGVADDVTVMRLSAEVEDLRRRQNTRRTLMLLRMRKILTAEQRLKLAALQRNPVPPPR